MQLDIPPFYMRYTIHLENSDGYYYYFAFQHIRVGRARTTLIDLV